MFIGSKSDSTLLQVFQTGFNELYRDKHKLNIMAGNFLEMHDHVYPNGKPAPRTEEMPLHTGMPVERDRVR